MVTGIAHAAFNVKDMETTIAFYEESPQMQFIRENG